METNLKWDGILHIMAETEIECYALKKWCDDNADLIPPKMLVEVDINKCAERKNGN